MKQKKETANEIGPVSFEEALNKLETIVNELESGELALEESLTKFATGMDLAKLCLSRLAAAEKQIDKIVQMEQGKLIEKPLELWEEEQC
ncbi:exonuclease vii small subunit [Lucifera butyrica]|uniref:Exodeoxyribonuclease 7 small subunit n=1 Tax=Lucifera butyrica TaxID=1351585 RepID=A0A498RFY6_9FIRM|nr:exodeoxyribonuclease VII small subunit [Lucifera butyrica]VBB08008.1 exonuclease vii small subunit [Lucifera butyrica]